MPVVVGALARPAATAPTTSSSAPTPATRSPTQGGTDPNVQPGGGGAERASAPTRCWSCAPPPTGRRCCRSPATSSSPLPDGDEGRINGAYNDGPGGADPDDPVEPRHPDPPLRRGRLRHLRRPGRRPRRHHPRTRDHPVPGLRRPLGAQHPDRRSRSSSTAPPRSPSCAAATTPRSATASSETDPTGDLGRVHAPAGVPAHGDGRRRRQPQPAHADAHRRLGDRRPPHRRRHDPARRRPLRLEHGQARPRVGGAADRRVPHRRRRRRPRPRRGPKPPPSSTSSARRRGAPVEPACRCGRRPAPTVSTGRSRRATLRACPSIASSPVDRPSPDWRRYGRRSTGVSLVAAPGDRIGVVGPNGTGKTTLLRALAGLIGPSRVGARRRRRAPPSATSPRCPSGRPTRRCASPLGPPHRRRRAPTTSCTPPPPPSPRREPGADDRYADALDRWLALGGADLDARAGEVWADLGLAARLLDQPTASLSGGEAARAQLAADPAVAGSTCCCSTSPPTTSTSTPSTGSRRFVDGLEAPLVLVSHDRAFLERTITACVELDEHTRTGHPLRGRLGGLPRRAGDRPAATPRRPTTAYADDPRRAPGPDPPAAAVVAGGRGEAEEASPTDNDKTISGSSSRTTTEKQAVQGPPVREGARPARRRSTSRGSRGSSGSRSPPRRAVGAVVARLDGAVVRPGRLPARPGRPRDRLGRAGGDPRAQRLGQVDAARRAARAAPARRGHRATSGPASWSARSTRAGACSTRDRPLLDAFTAASAGTPCPVAPPRPARCWPSSASAPTTSPGRRRRCRRASAPGRRSPCCRPGASTASCSTSRPTTSTCRPSSSSSRRSRPSRARVLLVTHDRQLLDAVTTTRTLRLDAGRVIDATERVPGWQGRWQPYSVVAFNTATASTQQDPRRRGRPAASASAADSCPASTSTPTSPTRRRRRGASTGSSGGRCGARFRSPVYDGDRGRGRPTCGDGGLEVRDAPRAVVRDGHGARCPTSRPRRPTPTTGPTSRRRPTRRRRRPRCSCAGDGVRPRRRTRFHADRGRRVPRRRSGRTSPSTRTRASPIPVGSCATPTTCCRPTCSSARGSTSSPTVQHLGVGRATATWCRRGRIVTASGSAKGHRFVTLDVLHLAGGRPVARTHHTAIYRPEGRPMAVQLNHHIVHARDARGVGPRS